MNTRFNLLALALLSLAFSSCCGLLPCSGSLSAQREVTKMQEVSQTIVTKNGSHVTTSQIPVTTTETVKADCSDCGSSFCPKPECCGVVSNQVISRATGQGGTGEPQIGLIPTMKTLAP